MSDGTISNDSVDENAAGPVAVGTLGAVDPDGETSFTFGPIDSAGGKCHLAGNSLSTAPGVTLDYEDASQHSVKLSATESGGLTLVQSLTIRVGNLNEAPTIALDFPAPPGFFGAPSAVLGSQLMLADPDAGAGQVEVSLSLVKGIFTIDDSSALAGKVTGNGSGKLVIKAVLADLNQTIKGGGSVYTADPSVEDDTLTVTIDDLGSSGSGEPNTATASTSFRVQLEPIQRFLDEFFTPAEQAIPDFGGLLGDADGDELNTLLKFNLGTSPLDAMDGKQSVELSELKIDGEFYTRISYVQRTDASTPHTCMSVRVASALSGWKSGDEVLMLTSRDPLGGDRERITLRTIARREGKGREFYQWFVEYSGFVN